MIGDSEMTGVNRGPKKLIGDSEMTGVNRGPKKMIGDSEMTGVNRVAGMSNNRKRDQLKQTGRSLLELLPLTSDILPQVKDCSYCYATKFHSETSNFCCLDGRIVLVNNELPFIMTDLLTSMSDEAKKFRTLIRTYNNLFAFTSLGVKSDCSFSKRNKGIYTFRVQGQVYHFINDLLPENDRAKNLQLYFHDIDNELQNRLTACPRLSEQVIGKCVQYVQQNPYAYFFRNLKDIPNLGDYKIILKTISGQDQRVYNKPEVSQVAAIWVEGENNGEEHQRSIEVKTHSNQSKSIEYYYGCYNALQYPLMFPFGETGWHQGIPKKMNTLTIEKETRLVQQTSLFLLQTL
ncbi:hypothetical protein OSB04_004201 [Centaurea solstitialis]|uniref:Helitron helicase-like domain-containing protein n=1 Tax=Centaurea solstitialis TaxID=347529 RepID=A0AA38WU65_9ASTR|nr:hypothetical protein OSB04_004201 [Centaurea solstitialis]